MAQQFELVKIICTSVVAVREGGRIVAELEGVPSACYTLEQMQDYLTKAESEVEAQNAVNGNRQQRRSRKQVEA